MGFQCGSCGGQHDEFPMAFHYGAPLPWYRVPEAERERRTLLASDQCEIDDERFYVLGRISIPVTGLEEAESFVWGVWVSIGVADYERMGDLWEQEGRESEPPYDVTLENELCYRESTIGLRAKLHTRPVGERPQIVLEPCEHVLAAEQREGVSFERLQALVAAAEHRTRL